MTNATIIKGLPTEVLERLKDRVTIYDKVKMYFENGKYNFATIITNNPADDFEYIGEFTADDLFTKNEQIANYINIYRYYPEEFEGVKNYDIIHTLNSYPMNDPNCPIVGVDENGILQFVEVKEEVVFNNDLEEEISISESEFKKEVNGMIEWATGEKNYKLEDLTPEFIARDITGRIVEFSHGMSDRGLNIIKELLSNLNQVKFKGEWLKIDLIGKLKEYNENLTVDQLDDNLQNEVLEWATNFAQESFLHEDEKDQVEKETLESRVCDVIAIIENE